MSDGFDRFWDIARGFQASRILLTGVELGVFAALAGGARTSAEVAAQIGADSRATDRLMNALVAMKLLTKKHDTFINSLDSQRHLVPGEPEYIGGALGHVVNMWKTWSTLTEAVKAGTSVYQRDKEEGKDNAVSFIAAMHLNAGGLAPSVIGELDLSGVRDVLDVGGGSGAYSIAFCRARDDIRAVVFDLPEVTILTRQYVTEVGLSDRITAVSGDYNEDELGSDFDLVFLSQILHSNSPEENLDLLAKCRRALKAGGQVVIQEFIVDPDRTSPPNAAVFSLNMLVATRAGDTYTEAEVSDWLERASFAEIRRADTDGGTTLIIARAV